MRSGPIIRMATGAFVVVMLVTAALVLTTAMRVEDTGPVIVYGIAVAGIVLLLVAPPNP